MVRLKFRGRHIGAGSGRVGAGSSHLRQDLGVEPLPAITWQLSTGICFRSARNPHKSKREWHSDKNLMFWDRRGGRSRLVVLLHHSVELFKESLVELQ